MWLQKPPLGVLPRFDHPLTKGLVLCLPFNEAGGNKVYDLSGNRNTGTLTNMAFPPTITSGWNPGKFGSALAFDGVSASVVTSDLVVSTPVALTALAWWRRTGNSGGSTNDYHIIIRSINGYALNQVLVSKNGDTLYALVYDTATRQDTFTIPNVNEWHQIGMMWNGSLVFAILDGILSASPTAATGVLASGSTALFMGRTGGTYYTNGLIDLPCIWNRALSAQEVQELYISPFGMFEERKNYWFIQAPAGGGFVPFPTGDRRGARGGLKVLSGGLQ